MLSEARMSELELLLADASAIEYKGIIFDEWTIDKETGGVYAEMCACCAEKYKDLLEFELDDGGAIGSCSVKGCDVVGLDNGDAKHYYVDFVPELIVPLGKERKLELDSVIASCENMNKEATRSSNKNVKTMDR